MRSALVSVRHAAAAAFAVGLYALVANADPIRLAPRCDAWDIEYALAANLKLSDTPLGQGDGVYKIGPGRAALRFDNRDGAPGGNVTLRAYEMKEHFTVRARTLFWNTIVETDTKTNVAPNACGVVATAALGENTLSWSSKLNGYRTDGTLNCTGSLCGKFGAPPAGKSELHIAPHPVAFGPLVFDKGLHHFKMDFTFVAKTAVPKQTAHLALAASELKRSCVEVRPCR